MAGRNATREGGVRCVIRIGIARLSGIDMWTFLGFHISYVSTILFLIAFILGGIARGKIG